MISAVVGVLGLTIWYFAFYPFVSTDDARVAATLVRVAPEAIGGRVLDAELDLFRARGGLVKAQANTIEALGKLELAVGHKILDKMPRLEGSPN